IPYEMANWSSGWTPNPPYLTKTIFDNILLKQDLFFEINPRTAKELGLKENDYVDVNTKLGQVRMRVHLFEGAMPGVIYAPLGFGHIGYDEFIKGKGVNISKVLWSEEDPVSGAPLWWGTKVKITRV
ncbi:MAG: molybdopterin dinucleotide binding domain-containing protein, partial [Desulfatiglandales bacterium]